MEKILTDEELVALYWERDEAALKHTEERYGRYMHNLAYSILGKDEDSAECSNDALLAVWNRIPPERPRSFKAYITSVVRRIALMRYRERTAQKRVESEYALCLDELADCVADALDTETAFEQKALRRQLNEFVQSLNKKQQYIFVSRYYLSVPVAGIAIELGCSASTVFYDLNVIKNKLQKKLQKEGF